MNFIVALAHLLLDFLPGAVQPDNGAPQGLSDPNGPVTNYQIDAPSTDYGAPVYSRRLLKHTFGASWGEPYTVGYTPPPESIDFSHVKLLLEVSTFGVQYDRLAHLYLNSIEVWRPSTSEPRGKPSHSNFTKDVSSYLALFSKPGQLSFELNNLVTEKLNGTFNVKLSAFYYNTPESPLSPNEWYEHEGVPATNIDNIVDVRVATSPIRTSIPHVPRNTTRAVLQVFASGNGNDEFWYADSTYGDENFSTIGPLRHINVRVDNDLAGVISPFYQIYTGGYQPALWSPFVSPNAYDVPSYQIDITPFLPSLWGDEDADDSVPLEIFITDSNDNIVEREWITSSSLFTWESEGVEGFGTRYPTLESNSSNKLRVPNIEITEFTQNISVTSDLHFHGKDKPATQVQWHQSRDISAVIIGGNIITHNSKGKSLASYAMRNYSRAFDYEIALALEESGIALAEGHRIHDAGVEPTSTEDLLSRTHNVHYNGSWYLPEIDSHTDRNEHERINGSDVFVKFRDLQRAGPDTYHQHAISRNGSVATFDQWPASLSPPKDSILSADYMDTVAHSSLRYGGAFPFLSISKEELDRRRMIREKWLRHSL